MSSKITLVLALCLFALAAEVMAYEEVSNVYPKTAIKNSKYFEGRIGQSIDGYQIDTEQDVNALECAERCKFYAGCKAWDWSCGRACRLYSYIGEYVDDGDSFCGEA